MKARYGYALVHRQGIVAASLDMGQFVYAIYQTKRAAAIVQREHPHCRVVRVRIEPVEK